MTFYIYYLQSIWVVLLHLLNCILLWSGSPMFILYDLCNTQNNTWTVVKKVSLYFLHCSFFFSCYTLCSIPIFTHRRCGWWPQRVQSSWPLRYQSLASWPKPEKTKKGVKDVGHEMEYDGDDYDVMKVFFFVGIPGTLGQWWNFCEPAQ